MEKISVYLVDDDQLVRAGIRVLLERIPVIDVAGEAGDTASAVLEVGSLRPDLVILDITLPDANGIDAIPQLRCVHPKVRILIASQHRRTAIVREALAAGADGYLLKSSDPEELELAVRSLHRGRTFVTPQLLGSLVGPASKRGGPEDETHTLGVLTTREREVFSLLAHGKANKEVAQRLHVSISTVKKHRSRLQEKLGLHSIVDICRLAIREGLMTP
jgi:DNA-binding NarL/FixJ family response regulator